MYRRAIAAVVVAMVALPVANAQTPDGGQPPAPALAQASRQQRTFNIPAQPLSSALNAFGNQAGIQVSIEASVARGIQSQPVVGTMTAETALRQMLAGTGIVIRFTPSGNVILSKPDASGVMQLDPIQVQGAFPVPPQAMIDNIPPPYAGSQVATGGQLGLLGNRDVMDTPFNQTSYTAKKAQDQQASTIRDVLIDDPSVRANLPDAGATTSDMVYIRGFSVNPLDTSYGGMYGVLPAYSIMAEVTERIEVLKGPSAMLNGMPPSGSLGGTINLVPKRAPEDALTQLTATYASASQFGAHADVARRFGPEKQFGVRFNGAFRAGQTPVAGNSDQRALALLGLDFRGERVRLSADLGYQYEYIGGAVPFLGLANGVQVPWSPSAYDNFGQPWNYTQRKDLFGVLRAEADLTERITLYASFGSRDTRLATLAGGAAPTVNNFNGNATATSFNQSLYNKAISGQAGIRALADTGPIAHEIAFTATTLQQEQGNVTVNGPAYVTNIYNPTILAQPNIPTGAANKTAVTSLSGLGLADTLSAADKRIQLTVGARLQEVKASNYNVVSGAQTSSYAQSALSPSVSLVFKPLENVSVYGNWIQGLQQGIIVGSTFANAGEVFPPYKTTQYEAGIKIDWGKVVTSASLFQITRPSTITDLATNTLQLAGEQRNQGLELNVFGTPTESVRLLGGIMLLNAVLTKTQGGLTDGWTAPFAPAVQLNLAGEWDTPFIPGLTLNGRVVYTGSQYVDATSPRRSIADWTRVDLGVRYTFDTAQTPTGKPLVARFVVENLLDANYWASPSLNVAPPRTFRLSLTSDF